MSEKTFERQRLWDAAERIDVNSLGEGVSKLGARALSIFQENGANSILILGCEQESDALLFAHKGFCVVTIDFSTLYLDQTGMKSKTENMRCGVFLAKNIQDKLPAPSSSVDAIYSKLLLCMDLREAEIKDIMWECLHVLKPAGLMVQTVFSEHDPGCRTAIKCGEDEWKVDRGFVSHFFNEDKIRRISKGFEILWIREYKDNRPPASGVMYEILLMKPK